MVKLLLFFFIFLGSQLQSKSITAQPTIQNAQSFQQQRLLEQRRHLEEIRQQNRESGALSPLLFRPTPVSAYKRPEQFPPVFGNRHGIRIREYLRHGFSKLVEGCDIGKRKPCGGLKATREQCYRWKCCWNVSEPVRCAQNTYYILRLADHQDFQTCGVAAKDLRKSSANSPPFNVILAFILSSRILGGFVAVDGQWPWIVYIYEKDINGDTSNQALLENGLCGGTLLNDEWILTAAHCFTTIDPALYGVVLGEHTITETSGREIRRDVEELIIFAEYNQLTFDNDVALIKVSRPITFNQNIRPSCLALPESSPSPGTICTALGWGFTTSPMGLRQDQLMQVNLPIFPDDACRDLTGMNSAEYNFRTFNIGDPKICAGGETGKDSCNGDSGGPLLCQENGVYVVHGIVSYGSTTCGLPLLPGIYSKVSDPDINEFITDNIGNFNL